MDGVEELPETLDDVDPCSPLVRLVEHQSIYGVSPPAETEWARMMYDGEDASAAIGKIIYKCISLFLFLSLFFVPHLYPSYPL